MTRELFSVEEETVEVSSELGKVRELSAERREGCGMRVEKEGKLGFSFASSPDLLPSDLFFSQEFYGWGKGGRPLLSDEGATGPEELVDALRGMLSRLDGVSANFVSVSFHKTGRSLGRSPLSLSETLFFLSAQVFVSTPSSVGFDFDSSRGELDFPAVAERAKKTALESREPGKAERGRMRVTLRPKAAVSLLSVLLDALSGTEVIAGRSPLADKLGENVSSLRIVDDPLKKDGLESRGFDDEGSETKKRTLIDGELLSFLHTVETAKRLGGEPGNAVRGYSSLPVAGSTNVVVEGPSGREGDTVVDWLSGTHTIPPSGDFSVEAKNVFQDGSPVKGVMLCGNLFEMLKEVELCGERRELAGVSTPSWTVLLDVV